MKVLDRCVGCGNCVPFCLFGAISSYGRAIISRDLCRECKLCIKYCPIDAIVDK